VTLVVVDASVGVKWFLRETSEALTDQAVGLLDRYDRQEIQFVVPGLFYVEIANAIWRALRGGRVSRAVSDQALVLLTQRQFATVPSQRLLAGAFQIAADFQRTVYDSIYVALAMESKAQLITADERLANALAARFPVKWLGAL
jgi:predicted nucleic acid-binding protein